MYKKTKKQLAYSVLKFFILLTLGIALTVSAGDIIDKIGIAKVIGEEFAGMIKSTVVMAGSILCLVGAITFGVANVKDIFGYLSDGREEGSITREEQTQSKKSQKAAVVGTKDKQGDEIDMSIKIISRNGYGLREIKSKEEIREQIISQKGR
jgi:hypothetical protein